MNALKLSLTLSTIAALAAACGGAERDVDARLDLPAARESKIALRPALDVSHLYDPEIADRLVIEEIDLNVSEVRLLGTDPRVPAGGLPLLERAQVLEAYDGATPALELPFPTYLADQEDLAVYIRVDRSAQLAHSSVVIRGRVYAHPVHGGSTPLTATQEGDDEIHPSDRASSIDPDGDPADGPLDHPNPDCSIDPDGDPAICHGHAKLVSRGETSKFVPFELRGDDVADLITGVASNAKLDVVIGIPGARWFTEQAMRAIDKQLRGDPLPAETGGKLGGSMRADDLIVIDSRLADRVEAAKEEIADEEYFAAEDNANLDDIKIRRPDRD